jgi:hypothetical protein
LAFVAALKISFGSWGTKLEAQGAAGGIVGKLRTLFAKRN